ncbi:MAG: tetratricopeptide repeat protein [Spirochaetales bacterium]|nr:tetratricopeptide repeat protein [Spirochaetales bacterium]
MSKFVTFPLMLLLVFTGCLSQDPSVSSADNTETDGAEPVIAESVETDGSGDVPAGWRAELEQLQNSGDTAALLVLLDEHRDELDGDTNVLYLSLLISDSRLEEADLLGKALLEEKPEEVSVLYMNALIRDMEGLGDEADSLIQKAYSLDGNDPDVNLFLAEMELRQKNYKEAGEYLNVILTQEPDNFSALVAKADVLMHLGQGNEDLNTKFLNDAVKVLDRVEEIAPDYVYTYVDRARALAVLGDTRGAMNDLNRAVELEPDVEWHYLDRVVLNLKYFGWLEKALEDIIALEAINPDNLFAHIYAAGIYDDLEDYDRALDYYEKVIAARPDYVYSYEGAGKIYYMKGQYDKAETCFLKSYELIYPYEGFILMAALAMKNQGENERAKRLLQESIGTVERESLMYEIFRYVKDGGSDFFITGEIARATDEEERNKAWFYVGEMYLLQDSPRSAQAAFRNLSDEKNFFEADIAHWYNRGVEE